MYNKTRVPRRYAMTVVAAIPLLGDKLSRISVGEPMLSGSWWF